MTRKRSDPAELSPDDAADRYLRRRRPDSTSSSLEGWKYRLKLFWEWCDEVGIEQVGDLQPYDIDEYYEHRSLDIEPITLEGEMWTLKGFLEFLEDVDAVDDGLSDAVRIPDLDQDDRSSDIKLHSDAALDLIEFFRNNEAVYGNRYHTFLELLWFTGARQGGIRGLDLRDIELDNATINFRHRPGSDTPLKNKRRGERPVAISDEVVDVLRRYIRHHRYDKTDEHGREPLFSTTQGRVAPQTLRTWSYAATLPCQHSPCPHGRDRDTCEWAQDYHKTSQCPSSRSPHQIRTGAITYMLNRGWPPEDVAARVNASVDTIEQHYDKADLDERRVRQRDRMERRRRPLVDELEEDSQQ